jgi:hypothetical protein
MITFVIQVRIARKDAKRIYFLFNKKVIWKIQEINIFNWIISMFFFYEQAELLCIFFVQTKSIERLI